MQMKGCLMKTRSAYVKSSWQTQIREIELPDVPPPGQALIRVLACGICSTDLTTAQTASQWQAFGHEIAGVIEKIDPSVGHLKAGDHVVLESSSFCGHCDVCRDGRVDLCNKAPNFWGAPSLGFSEHMLAPVTCLVPYEGLAPDIACLIEPAGVAVDMVATAGIRLGDRVCVVGPGPIALMAMAMIKHSGVAELVCVGRAHSIRRLALARELGASIVATDQPLNSLADLAKRFDHVIVTAPVGVIPEAIALLAYGGELTYIGIGTGSGMITFDANDFHFRKLQLRASFASPAIYYPTALRLMKSGMIPGPSMISHRFKLSEIGQAMTACREDKAGVVKVIVTPDAL